MSTFLTYYGKRFRVIRTECRCRGFGNAGSTVHFRNGRVGIPQLFLTDDRLLQGIELMFFAYRGFTSDPDRILEQYGYGRAHHRAIHFINRSPGITVNRLLEILGVTKQSLTRVRRQLVQ